MNYMTRK